MSRYAHALHATLSSHLIRSRLIARVFPRGPFLSLSLALVVCSFTLSLSLSFLVLDFTSITFSTFSHSPFPFSFFSPSYPAPSRRPFNSVSSARGYAGPLALFSLGHRLFHSFLTRQTRRPIFLGFGDASYFYPIRLQRFENDIRYDRVEYRSYFFM